jgi:protein-tyrosine phosphatase
VPEPTRLLFVCLGNICRSPTAEAVMASLVAEAGLAGEIEVDSAGTGSWHVGAPPDRRSAAEARRRGVAMASRARQAHPGDLGYFDLVLAMDRQNLVDLHDLAPRAELAASKVRLLRAFDPASGPAGAEHVRTGGAPADDRFDVPDPYYGTDGFADVYDLVAAACAGLLDHVRPDRR